MAADFEVIAEFRTDVGCRRKVNEDSSRFSRPSDPETLAHKGVLAMVADGMGGHAAGEIASRLAVETVARVYYGEQNRRPADLVEAVRAANRRIYAEARRNGRFFGMGTTCTALVLRPDGAQLAHVGDSRLYLVRDREIYLMSEDHSAVMNLYRHGVVSLEAARRHEDKNVILRALGPRPEVEVMSWPEPFPVRRGDRFLLCSDGLSDLVDDAEMLEAVVSAEPGAACEHLVALARERGGDDNITVGLVCLDSADVAQPVQAVHE